MRGIIMAIVALIFSVALFGATYVVRDGDSLEGIAATNGVSVETLAQVNNIDPPYIIWVGMKLTVASSEVVSKNPITTDSTSTSSFSRKHRKVFVWTRKPTAEGGAGCFWNDKVDGYYRFANVKWQPVRPSKKSSCGLGGEINDNFCQETDGNWSQTALGFKVGPVLDFYNSGYWFNCWSIKMYYSFCHAESHDDSWSKIQEDKIWSANLWVNVYSDTTHWLSKTNVCSEYNGKISAKAVGGNVDQIISMEPYSPVRWETSLEESLYNHKAFDIKLNFGYRHIDGEPIIRQDRVFLGTSVQLSWMKILYELETNSSNNNNTQRLEARLSF